ncbi:MerR family transcriptional regulator [Myceligenerans xiligouense]|uniref:DNA-binding transcriptional MerR regulator n=1 Tax=Myceligenerans xiligouense TaxID=253184 RepID=A0A3N4Z7N0_9MICO|nr:MerR family transcriptional regulator [Myceligenerans xiligouense]RPF21332.1 DNA-binding transcriptional MerR regulator [Myceligenerans xiligouense]
MTWSTRELADLAGTTVNTIRHYHALKLLNEPSRRYNGYKQYGVTHLVRLLRLRRLAELGVPLAQIGAVGESDLTDALRDLDAALQDEIERSRRARADIAAILRADAPVDTPHGFESVAGRLSETDRALIHICTRLYDAEAIASLRRMVAAEPPGVSEELAALPPDASDTTRERLAARIARSGAHWRSATWPWLHAAAERTLVQALAELYTPAQRDVLRRARTAAHEQPPAPDELADALCASDR